VFTVKPSEITAESIVSFVSEVQAGSSKEYKIDEEVVYSEEDAKADEEL